MLVTEILSLLNQTNSKDTKVQILMRHADNHALRTVLYQAYQPRFKYFIKSSGQTGKGEWTLDDQIGNCVDILTSLRLRTITGEAARAKVAQFASILTPRDAELFHSILKKDLRCGINVATINAAIPGLIDDFKFMKAYKYEEGDIYKHGGLYISLKIDCIRGLLRDGEIFSSGGKLITGVQHLAKDLPNNLSLDMELTIPGLDFNAASGKLRSNSDCPTVVAQVFDIPSMGTSRFAERYEFLAGLFSSGQLLDRPGFALIRHKFVTKEEDITRNFEKALSAGFEGLVCKTAHHQYQNKRSKDWLKMTAEDPEDGIIVGFEEGTGKYAGSLGTCLVQRPNGVIVKVPGYSDAMKAEIWNNKDKYLNKCIAYKFHEETPGGSVRHPRFFRMRWDKDK